MVQKYIIYFIINPNIRSYLAFYIIFQLLSFCISEIITIFAIENSVSLFKA